MARLVSTFRNKFLLEYFLMHKIIKCIFIVVILSGCSSTAIIKISNYNNAQSKQQLALINNFVADKQYSKAYYFLANSINQDIDNLSDIKLQLKLVKIALLAGKTNAAESILAKLAQHKYITNDTENFIKFKQLQAEVLYANQLFLQSAQILIDLQTLLKPAQQQSNKIAIWNSLIEVSPYSLLRAINQKDHYQVWLTLAYIAVKHRYNFKEQQLALKQWYQSWPPAAQATTLPLQLLTLNNFTKLAHIAVLLPLSAQNNLSAISKIISHGFIAAYFAMMSATSANKTDIEKCNLTVTNGDNLVNYDNNTGASLLSANDQKQEINQVVCNAGRNNLTITFIDSDKYNDNIIAAIDVAYVKGAQLVVGPLQKKHVNTIINKDNKLPIPVLSLNYGDLSLNSTSKNLLQFALMPEDEVKQIALQAWAEGKRRAAVIAIKNQWGNRLANSFIKFWQQLGGKIVFKEQLLITSNYSQLAEKITNISIKDIHKFKKSQEDIPMYRRDIDFIFLAAPAQQAQRIKSTLNFYLAGDLPIYATADVYTVNDGKQNNDIENIYFPSMPWLFKTYKNIYHNINNYWRKLSLREHKMYAFGFDAFILAINLDNLLAITDDVAFFGATGKLLISNKGMVKRQLIWSKIYDGKLTAVTTHKQSKSLIYSLNKTKDKI